MSFIKYGVVVIGMMFMLSCASGYKPVHPTTVDYKSQVKEGDLVFQYKFDVLSKKYARKQLKKGVKLVAVKFTNTSDKDLIFGKDFEIIYGNGNAVEVLDVDQTFNALKQKGAFHLFYLLLTPMQFNSTTSTNVGGRQLTETSSTPIGLVIGPALAATNIIVAGTANTKFKEEMLRNNIYGETIKKGDVKYGLLGIKSDSYDNLTIKMN